MKKIFTLILALAMILTVAATAEETTVEMVDWDTLSAADGMDVYAANGQFYELTGIGLKVWIPSGLEQKESEYTPYLFTDEEGTRGLSVFVEDAPEGMDPMNPDELFAYVQEMGGDEATPTVINGIYCVSYRLGGEELVQFCLTYGAESGHLIHFIVDGVDPENGEDTAVLLLMLGSVSAI